ncbi:MAG: polysaccharide deacetylase family protein [Tunicatimonas sp.]|uniref:polysaccharide deacetylase family protein n=1 Tax=Tunicatimonas sp. TaxID=1940096 RepID=UPI003C771604
MLKIFRVLIIRQLLYTCFAVAASGTLIGCNKTERPAGIWLSFDDRSINEWYALKGLFKRSDVIVTFFITQPDSLTTDEVAKLRELQRDGHEIGFHGTRHVVSEHFIQERGYRSYLSKEIDQGLQTMTSYGFNCQSFAYPYGAKFWFTDLILRTRFQVLRGVATLDPEKNLATIDDIYHSFDGDRTLTAISFDNNSGTDSLMIEKGMQRAAENNEVIMFYAHAPTDSDQKGYFFSTKMLEFIIEETKNKNLKFYTAKTLTAEAQ